MNKKLFALLVVSACALQLNAADAGGVPDAAGITEGAPRDAGSGDDYGSDDGSAPRRAAQAAAGMGATEGAPRDAGSAPTQETEAAPEDTSAPTSFVMPGDSDNLPKAIARRLLNKVWTRGVDATLLKDILRHGADHFDAMKPGGKATYFNAQDAQWGVNSSRAFKAVRAIVVAGFVKLFWDALHETEDDEDEDDVAVAA